MATKLKAKDLSVGDLVTVNDLPDTQLYTIKTIYPMKVDLVYRAGGRICSGGTVDISILQVPTLAQLENQPGGLTMNSFKPDPKQVAELLTYPVQVKIRFKADGRKHFVYQVISSTSHQWLKLYTRTMAMRDAMGALSGLGLTYLDCARAIAVMASDDPITTAAWLGVDLALSVEQ